MATRGLLGPDGKSPPILKGLRCIHFQPPNFTLGESLSTDPQVNLRSYLHTVVVLFFSVTEVQCLNDTQKYLRRIVHEIGLELRSTAVCKGVRRTRDGPFTLEDALVRQQWTAVDIIQAVRQYHASKKRRKSPPTKINHTSTAAKHQEEHQICNETPAVI